MRCRSLETRREQLTRLAFAGVVALGLGCGASAPPNVLLIVVDTLRADVVSPYGGVVEAPAFQQLARTGVVVEGACTPTPSTGPAHASLMTGLHPWHHEVLGNAVPLAEEELRLAPQFRSAGYDTAAFVSSFNVSRFGFERGFETFDFRGTRKRKGKFFWRPGAETTEAALRWLGRRGDAPFLMWVHYFDPHYPYDAPAGYERPESEPVDLEGKSGRRPWKLTAIIRGYRGNVAYSDVQIGRLLSALRVTGRLENTVVVVTADHGEGLGDHGLTGHGRNLHDELVSVPLLIRGPGILVGRRLRGPAQLEDLMPTLLSLAGLPTPPDLDGFDLSPWLRGDRADSPRGAVVGRVAPSRDLKRLYFTRRWPEKWIGEIDGIGVSYDLGADPEERVEKLSKTLPAALARAATLAPRAARPHEPDAETKRALEALGYLGGGEGVPDEEP